MHDLLFPLAKVAFIFHPKSKGNLKVALCDCKDLKVEYLSNCKKKLQ